MSSDPQYNGRNAPARASLVASGAFTGGASAAQITATSTTYDYAIVITNTDSTDPIYMGFDNTVTGPGTPATCGGAILAGVSIVLPPSDISSYWFIAPTGAPVCTFMGFNVAGLP